VALEQALEASLCKGNDPELLADVMNELDQVIVPFPQTRDPQVDLEPPREIRANLTRLVRCRNKRDWVAGHLAFTESAILSVFEHPEKSGLKLRTRVAEFVERNAVV
jgi:hypothetical protein